MKKRKLFSAALALVLSLTMLLSLVPVFASAAEGDEADAQSANQTTKDMYMKKTAVLADDGTYTITLEAFATGETTTTTVTKGVPLDIVLVLDQSGSMEDEINTTTYTARASASYSNRSYQAILDSGTTLYYKASDGGYYPVSLASGTLNATGEYIRCMAYDTTSTSYAIGTPYVHEEGTSYDQDAILYTGVLYEKTDGTDYTKLELLKKSVNAFIQEIYENGQQFGVNHRVSVVGFASSVRGTDDNPPYSNTGLFVNGTLVSYNNSELNSNPVTSGYVATYSPKNFKKAEHDDLDPTKRYYVYKGTAGNVTDVNGTSRYIPTGDYALSCIDGEWRYTRVTNDAQYYFKLTGSESIYEYPSTLTAADYQASLVSVSDGNGITDSITQSIDKLAASGATFISDGLHMAHQVFANNPLPLQVSDPEQQKIENTRQRVVVVLTDGEPGQNGYNRVEANQTLTNSIPIKDPDQDNAVIYTLGLFSENPDDDTHDFLRLLSSDCPDATSINSTIPDSATTSPKYHFNAQDVANLHDMFSSITSDIISPSTSVKLDENAVMKDFFTDGFDISKAAVSISVFDGTVDELERYTWTDEVVNPTGITCTIQDNVVSVTGFDYAENYITQAHPGKKIVVTITGVEATDAAVTGQPVYTNTNKSGIYTKDSDTDPFVLFVNPTVVLTEKAYVVDYAKPFTMNPDDWKASSVLNLTKDMTQFSAEVTAAIQAGTHMLAPELTYGKLDISDGYQYTPQTMQWDGYDRFYSFGKDTGGLNQWSRISVIPATSVYYEDTFITNVETGVVGIEYSGNWTEVGEESGNTEDPSNPVHGWIEDLADDSDYSDGSAHEGKPGAMATFTFTGTGVDVYSRTNTTTGVVRVILYTVDGSNEVMSKYYIMDNEAASGDYYQIPTVFFSGLEYGTYKVEIQVVSATNPEPGDNSQNEVYYLDGIRIYNPLSPDTKDEVVDGAYGDFTVDAIFTCLREQLLDDNAGAEAFADGGAVFIDKIITEAGTGETTPEGEGETGETTPEGEGETGETTPEGEGETGETTPEGEGETGETTPEGQEETGETDTQTKVETSVKTNVVGTYAEVGPKNEIYLAKGQSVTFKLPADLKYLYVGMKAPAGETTAQFSGVDADGSARASTPISGPADLYYEIDLVADENGTCTVVIQNTGDNLLAITKMVLAANNTAEGIPMLLALTADEAVATVNAFELLPEVEYTGNVVELPAEPEAPVEPETPAPENPGEVEIFPMEPEKPADTKLPVSWLQKLFEMIFSWFRT